MSIAEVPPDIASLPEGRPAVSIDRRPPQDTAAEMSVLGAMMLSKDAIADVVEILREDDFYLPANQLIFGAIRDLFAKGEPADVVTVANALSRSGDLDRVGGAAELSSMIQGVATPANADYYANIVREQAVLRRLVTAATRITKWGYEGEGEVDKIVDRAQQEIFEVSSGRTTEDYLPLADIMEGAVEEIEGIASRGGELVGVPTGFIDLDRLTNGFHAGQLIILAARPAIGKALALDTPVPTPDGWRMMAELSVDDLVFGTDGRPTAITAATEVMTGRPCHRVSFSDGASLVADEHHQWDVLEGARRTVTTGELEVLLSSGPVTLIGTHPLQGPSSPDAEAMYDLGVALAREWSPDAPAIAVHKVRQLPPGLLRSSEQERRSFLAGVLDTCADITADGAVRFTLRRSVVAAQMHELLVTLGFARDLEVREGDHERGLLEFLLVTDEQLFGDFDRQTQHKEVMRPAAPLRITAVERVASVPVRCIEVAAPDHCYLAGRTMVPTHNSTLGLDIARAASIQNGLTSAIFSLEMSRNEIVMRLLSAEAQISLQNMRSGRMSDPDWRKIASRQGVLHEAPLFIDDSPNLTMTEIRAKCRRLKQRNDLRLVVVDYMQLMQSGKKVESRQQEVSEFSRSLKLLAKELEVPVIAISQLNRGPEARNDKKPMLSDLRESGCLPARTKIIRADTGAEVTLGELHASGARNVPVWSLDDSLRHRARTMTHVFPTGHREVFEVVLRSGRRLHATANHKLLTYGGWLPLDDLAPGGRIAVPRHVPAPLDDLTWDEDELVLLAHLLGDGSFVKRQPIRYASVSEENLNAVAEAASRRFGISAVRDEYAAARVTSLRLPAPFRLARGRRNPIAAWLDGLGLFGARSHEKFVPSAIAGLRKDQVALFLAHLWATDGSITIDRNGLAHIYYATTSRALADGVARLLLRFGLVARIHQARKPGYRPSYHVTVSGVADQKVFLRRVGGFGPKAAAASVALARLEDVEANTNVDTVPLAVWDDVRSLLADSGMSHREFQAQLGTSYCGSTLFRTAPSQERLGRVAGVLANAELEMMATNDVHWDEIVSIDSVGFEDVFDATVLGTHNFVADGVTVHNSLEQDADMVILIHREDAYEKDTERLGEADLIVAKHRNGPTDTVTVSFQGHYSRFVDMASE